MDDNLRFGLTEQDSGEVTNYVHKVSCLQYYIVVQ